MRGRQGTDLDFKRINETALASPDFLQSRRPQAKRQGRNSWPGRHLRPSWEVVWLHHRDRRLVRFCDREAGGDIISLVAAQAELSQAKAAG